MRAILLVIGICVGLTLVIPLTTHNPMDYYLSVVLPGYLGIALGAALGVTVTARRQ